MEVQDTIKILGGIRFSVLSPVEIRKYSVVEITAPETYDEDGMSVQGGHWNPVRSVEPVETHRLIVLDTSAILNWLKLYCTLHL